MAAQSRSVSRNVSRHNALALTYMRLGQMTAALDSLRAAIAAADKLKAHGEANKADAFAHTAFESLVGACNMRLARSEQAEAAYRTCLKVSGELVAEDPLDRRAQYALAEAECNLSMMLIEKHPEEALHLADQALEGLQPALADGNHWVLSLAIAAHQHRAGCLAALHRQEDAESSYKQAVNLATDLLRVDPTNIDHALAAARLRRDTAAFYTKLGRHDKALDVLQTSQETLSRQTKRHGEAFWCREETSQTCGQLSNCYVALNRWKEAEATAAIALSAAEANVESDVDNFAQQMLALSNLSRLAQDQFCRTLSLLPLSETKIWSRQFNIARRRRTVGMRFSSAELFQTDN